MTQQDLSIVEGPSEMLYTDSSPQLERDQAAKLQLFLEPVSLDVLPLAHWIMENSASPYAVFLATNCITKIVDNQWTSLNLQARMEMRTNPATNNVFAFSQTPPSPAIPWPF